MTNVPFDFPFKKYPINVTNHWTQINWNDEEGWTSSTMQCGWLGKFTDRIRKISFFQCESFKFWNKIIFYDKKYFLVLFLSIFLLHLPLAPFFRMFNCQYHNLVNSVRYSENERFLFSLSQHLLGSHSAYLTRSVLTNMWYLARAIWSFLHVFVSYRPVLLILSI